MNNLRVIFFGTPNFSVPVLKELIKNTNVILVVTQPDKLVGREQVLSFSAIKELAVENNIPVFTPVKVRIDFQTIIDYKPDIIITCAYGQIIPKEVLDCPKYGCINVHASLLPKLRGGAPIHHAIIDGYEKTGITIMYMDEKMDNGDIITQEGLIIDELDNVGTLHDKLSIMGSELLIKTLPSIIAGTNKRTKQNMDEVTFGYNIKREEEKINFNKKAREVYNQIRGLYPFPTAYMVLDNEEIKVLSSYEKYVDSSGNIGSITSIYSDGIGIKTLDGEIVITKIKPFGKKEMFVKGEWWTWANSFNFWRIVTGYLTNFNIKILRL